MQVGTDDGGSVSWEVPCWFTNLGATVEQSFSEASSSCDTTSVDGPASAAGAVIPYGYSVDAYTGATSGLSSASPAWLSLAGPETEALDSLSTNTHSFPTAQAPFQQPVFVRDVGTAATFDQSFAEAAQRASSACLNSQAQHAAYGTVAPLASYAGANIVDANMLVDATYVAVDDACVDSLEHGLPDSPTLGTSTASIELEQPAGHTASEMSYYQTPHFSEYPRKSTETWQRKLANTAETSALRRWAEKTCLRGIMHRLHCRWMVWSNCWRKKDLILAVPSTHVPARPCFFPAP